MQTGEGLSLTSIEKKYEECRTHLSKPLFFPSSNRTMRRRPDPRSDLVYYVPFRSILEFHFISYVDLCILVVLNELFLSPGTETTGEWSRQISLAGPSIKTPSRFGSQQRVILSCSDEL